MAKVDKAKVLTLQERAEVFHKEYIELCKKHKIELVAEPNFRRSMDTGVFGIVIEMKVKELSG